jgi:hypothetical protein
MKKEQIECSETSAYKIQTQGNYPEENIQYTEYGESLKSGIQITCLEFINTVCWTYMWKALSSDPHESYLF